MDTNYHIRLGKSIGISVTTILFLGLSVIFFALNHAVPFYADDYVWTGTMPEGSLWTLIVTRLQTLDFLPTSCGRLTCHLACQLLIPFGEMWFDCINAVMLLAAMLLTRKLCFRRLKDTALACLLIILAYFYFPPSAETLFYWGSGSANYLLPLLLVLLFLCGMRTLEQDEAGRETSQCGKTGRVRFGLLCLTALAAGWSHEIFSLPIACAIVGCAVLRRKRKPGRRQAIACGAFLLGSACLVLSPRSLGRLLSQEGGASLTLGALTTHLLQGFKMFRDGKWIYVILALLILSRFRHLGLRNFVKDNLFYSLCLVASVLMIAVLGHGGRAVWGIEVFSFLLVFRFVDWSFDRKRQEDEQWQEANPNQVSAQDKTFAHCAKHGERLALVACLCLTAHQAMLIGPFHEAWGTYRSAKAETLAGDRQHTVPMEDWQSGNPLIDPFVAHPYRMWMHDIWMRCPDCHNICRKDIYETLQSTGIADSTLVCFGDVWVANRTDALMNKIETGQLWYELLPITYGSQGSALTETWHMLLQRILPGRYPTRVAVTGGDILPLKVGAQDYILFNQPFCPIWRDIKNITE